MPRYDIYTVGTCHGYGSDMDFTQKSEALDTIRHGKLPVLQNLTVNSSTYLLNKNQVQQSTYLKQAPTTYGLNKIDDHGKKRRSCKEREVKWII